MPPKREIREVIVGEEVRAKLLKGAKYIYDAVSSTFGPDGNNVILTMPFGDPTITRDGVTVAKRLSGANVGFEDRIESDAGAVMRQASEKTNKTAGDGTTATIVLGYHLLEIAHKRISAGEKPRLISKSIEEDGRKSIEFLESKSVKATPKQLLQVATVSSGDENIGKLVTDTLKDIGSEGAITIREQTYPTIDVEKVNGYYFDKGFYALNAKVEYEKPKILVTQKRLSTIAEIVPILDIVIKSDNPKMIIIGDVSGDALAVMINNVLAGKLDAVVIPPPAFGDDSKLFLEDIAIYVGAKLFYTSESTKSIALEDFGTADRVQVSNERAIIFGGDGDNEEITDRAKEIRDNIDTETSPNKKDQLEQRFAKLTGKVAIVNVGGSTQAEMEEIRYRVEDAIESVKSAMQDGVLPGGGTSIIKSSENLSGLFSEAIENTFRKLMDNAGEDGGYRLKQLQYAPFGHGFNLREMTEEPIDLTKTGIWDATRAVVQTVENAVSAATSIIKVGAAVSIIDQQDLDNIDQPRK